MKPREFDDLVKQKFEQADFEYNPQNWERLAEDLDGRTKKRGLLFWWMPLVGIAASVTLAFGITTAIREGGNNMQPAKAYYTNATEAHNSTNAQHSTTTTAAPKLMAEVTNTHKTTRHITTNSPVNQSGGASIKLADVLNYHAKATTTEKITSIAFNNNLEESDEKEQIKPKKKLAINKPGMYTFMDQPKAQKVTKVAIALSGGVNYGTQSSGYTIGATARRMINDKVFVEGDIAFIGTSSTQKTEYLEKSASSGVASVYSTSGNFGAKGVLAKSSSVEAEKNTVKPDMGVIKSIDQNYNSYYAQVTPSIGYKLMKRMSLGVGPDFQQMLVDNRPAASTVDRGNIKEAPMFDVGFMGKTEYAVSKNVKAAVYYREGINNIITPTNKYIDRNYIQVQVKCTILNR